MNKFGQYKHGYDAGYAGLTNRQQFYPEREYPTWNRGYRIGRVMRRVISTVPAEFLQIVPKNED